MSRGPGGSSGATIAWMVVAIVVGMLGSLPAGSADRQDRALGYLTAPSARDALQIAEDFARVGPDAAASRSLAGPDSVGPEIHFDVQERVENASNGCTHLFLRQRISGLEVWNGDLAITVDEIGRVLSAADRFVRNPGQETLSPIPSLDVRDAIREATSLLALEIDEALVVLRTGVDPAGFNRERATDFAGAGVAKDEIATKLVWLNDRSRGLRLAWNIRFEESQRSHAWDLNVDAHTGELLNRVDAVRHETYRVFPAPLASPNDGGRELVVDPYSPSFSPDGWHQAGGSSFGDTQGNNVVVESDEEGDDAVTPGFRPTAAPGLVFDFPLNLAAAPESYLEASITNAFYWANLGHDLFASYGFDEAAGNYQRVNEGSAGFSGDPVLVDVQDGAGVDNALFRVARDGSPGRMELFLWTHGGATLSIEAPPVLAGDRAAGLAQFGPPLPGQGPLLPIVEATDPIEVGAGFSSRDACSALSNPTEIAGNLALVDRGLCDFIVKVANAEAAGAAGVIVANNQGDELLSMAPPSVSIGIPSLFIGQSLGQELRGQISMGEVPEARLSSASGVNFRDSALDATTILHEYAHGVTIRLSGGAQNVSCLTEGHGLALGEGWSDFYGLAFTSEPGDSPFSARGFAAYLAGLAPTSSGIRNFPYSGDLAINPQTYGDIENTNQPHGAGEIWAATLWDLYWLFVQEYGFDPDFENGQGGNNLALQLSVDALKIQGCEPTFLEARDAILQADLAATGGQNECEIWSCFARRGMGLSAGDNGGDPSDFSVTEAFDLPAGCTPVQLVPEPSLLASLISALAALGSLAGLRRLNRFNRFNRLNRFSR